MKSKEEVGETLRELVRVLLSNETPNMKRQLAVGAVASLVDDLCETPDVSNPCDLPDGKPLLDPCDPTDDAGPSYWLWLDRRLDRPYLGPLSYDRALPADYMQPTSEHQNPMRYALGPGWRGRKCRITVTDITDGEPQPKLAADTPSAPESWQEERRELFAECARLREEASQQLSVSLAQARELAEVITWRDRAIAAAGLEAVGKSPSFDGYIEWARTIVGDGINLTPLDLFAAVKQEVAILLETSRANERNAKQSAEQHAKCRRVITRLTQWMAQEMATGPFHESRVAHVQDKLKVLLYEQFGPSGT